MILISHRGNINGIDEHLENEPSYIMEAINQGYDVEIDVWFMDGEFYLGHDLPDYKTDLSFLRNNRFWCHAKNIEALNEMVKAGIHCFWHQEDDVVLTSRGFLWTFPGQELTDNSIAVLPEIVEEEYDLSNCYAICSDFIEQYKTEI